MRRGWRKETDCETDIGELHRGLVNGGCEASFRVIKLFLYDWTGGSLLEKLLAGGIPRIIIYFVVLSVTNGRI